MKIIKIILINIVCFLLFQKCSFFKFEKDVEISSQNLIFDNLKSKSKKYKVNLYTTIKFNSQNIEQKDYEGFSIVINQDTLPLILKQKIIKKDKNNFYKIRYISFTDFESENFENDSLANVVINFSKILKKDKIINKAKDYHFKSLVTLPKRTPNKFDL